MRCFSLNKNYTRFPKFVNRLLTVRYISLRRERIIQNPSMYQEERNVVNTADVYVVTTVVRGEVRSSGEAMGVVVVRSCGGADDGRREEVGRTHGLAGKGVTQITCVESVWTVVTTVVGAFVLICVVGAQSEEAGPLGTAFLGITSHVILKLPSRTGIRT